jgi:antitoxin (DNA-binding transcriptional repressor) of toxin-antitoxin stability system
MTDLTKLCKVCGVEWNRDWPAALVYAVGRWGRPVGVEDARKRWAELVSLAESGTPTLITQERSGWAWAVLVPLAELYEPQWSLPTHQVSAARPKLAGLVRAAQAGTPQLLHRHYTAVAAVMTADRVISVPPGERLDVDELLRSGATITLTYDPGFEGSMTEDGDLAQEPEPAFVMASALDPAGGEIGLGTGTTAAQALALLHRRPTEQPIQATRDTLALPDTQPTADQSPARGPPGIGHLGRAEYALTSPNALGVNPGRF